MSDTPTLTVYEKCKHDRLEPHASHWLPIATGSWRHECPGGREILMQKEWHEGWGDCWVEVSDE